MKRRHRQSYDDELLRDGQRLRVPMFAMDSHLRRVHDGTGDSGLAMHRPGFRVTDAPLSDDLQRGHDAYEYDLKTAWRRGAVKESAVAPDAPRASSNDAMRVSDIESLYRRYLEKISK